MPRQTKNILLFFFAFAMLVTVLMQSACKEEKKDEDCDASISQEDFYNKFKGEWYIHYYSNYYYLQPLSISLVLYEDRLVYFGEDEQLVYALNDTNLCFLPEIENIQYWTINVDNDKLMLETQDLCGVSHSYEIKYNNQQYACDIDYKTGEIYRDESHIYANIELVNPDTIIALNYFYYRNDPSPFMEYRLVDGENEWLIRLYRKGQ